jgi:hypothetical protein
MVVFDDSVRVDFSQDVLALFVELGDFFELVFKLFLSKQTSTRVAPRGKTIPKRLTSLDLRLVQMGTNTIS